MLNKLQNILMGHQSDTIPNGLGVPEIPMEVHRGKQSITSSDFKKVVNEIFTPKIQEMGFKGKDFYFYREYPTYTQAVFFWTHKAGGAIQLVKFKNIHYLGPKITSNMKDIRPETAEFFKRLSPNNKDDDFLPDNWFWLFQHTLAKNKLIVEDIWRVFSTRGLEFFNRFENHRDYIEQITVKNYIDFKDFQIQNYALRNRTEMIYFLFSYWQQAGNKTKALAFAKEGYMQLKDDPENIYLNTFTAYIEKTLHGL
jgi:hypothetical protein